MPSCKGFLSFFLSDLDALDKSSDDDNEDGFRIFDDARDTHAGGDGTARLDRAALRTFIHAANGFPEVRRRFGMDGEWGRIYFIPAAAPGSLAWDDFIDKFRVPLPMFNWIMQCTKDSGKFPFEAPPTRGHEPQPLCLKLAAYFRYLATSAQVSAHEEGSGIARKILQVFSPNFGEWFVSQFYDEWIRMPTTSEELRTLEKPFRMAGLLGAVCSQDAVHVGWDRCPSALKADHTGMENYPTLAWNVCVAHTTRILSVHGHKRDVGASRKDWVGAFKGATNDKTNFQTDPMITSIGTKDLFLSTFVI
jgi:hypothetical protein